MPVSHQAMFKCLSPLEIKFCSKCSFEVPVFSSLRNTISLEKTVFHEKYRDPYFLAKYSICGEDII